LTSEVIRQHSFKEEVCEKKENSCTGETSERKGQRSIVFWEVILSQRGKSVTTTYTDKPERQYENGQEKKKEEKKETLAELVISIKGKSEIVQAEGKGDGD